MKVNYDFALAEVLKWEGGFVNHPKDPGGITNLGVTKAVYEKWIGKKVTEADMRKLTFKDVAPIYKKNYWDRISGDELPTGIDLEVFDFGVNAGPDRAIKFLQRLVNEKQDGKIGPKTLAAVKATSPKILIKQYATARETYYRSLKAFPTFGKGWLRRNDGVLARALTL